MLTDIAVKNSKPKEKSYKLYDANGLYLEVSPNGSKYWRFKYRFGGKEKKLSIGTYPLISVVEAREKRDLARKNLLDNIDPSEAKKDAKIKPSIDNEKSFEYIAREWHSNQIMSWTPRHANYVIRRLEADIFPALGNKQINDITAPQLLDILRKIEARGAIDIAHRVLQTTGQVFRYAIATGRAERDISRDLKGALKTTKIVHYASLSERDLPEFLNKLENYDGEPSTKLALKLILLTFVRSGELRAAKWEEFNFEKNEWRIPDERMKMRDPHIVPLSRQTILVLNELKQISSSKEFLFPNRNNSKTFISENTMLYALYQNMISINQIRDLITEPNKNNIQSINKDDYIDKNFIKKIIGDEINEIELIIICTLLTCDNDVTKAIIKDPLLYDSRSFRHILSTVILCNNIEILKELIEQGINLNTTLLNNMTSLDIAIMSNNHVLAEYLRAYGAVSANELLRPIERNF